MRIGLDGMPLAQLKTGVGTYTIELARALAAQSPHDDFNGEAHLAECLQPLRPREIVVGKRDAESRVPDLIHPP